VGAISSELITEQVESVAVEEQLESGERWVYRRDSVVRLLFDNFGFRQGMYVDAWAGHVVYSTEQGVWVWVCRYWV
jgi:hypothetical protein